MSEEQWENTQILSQDRGKEIASSKVEEKARILSKEWSGGESVVSFQKDCGEMQNLS